MSELHLIMERASIHFASATSLVMITAVWVRFLQRKTHSKWLPKSMYQTLIYAGLTVFAISTMREAYDVAHGQPLVKAFTDYASWLVGTGFGAWGLYRWHHFRWS